MGDVEIKRGIGFRFLLNSFLPTLTLFSGAEIGRLLFGLEIGRLLFSSFFSSFFLGVDAKKPMLVRHGLGDLCLWIILRVQSIGDPYHI